MIEVEVIGGPFDGCVYETSGGFVDFPLLSKHDLVALILDGHPDSLTDIEYLSLPVERMKSGKFVVRWHEP